MHYSSKNNTSQPYIDPYIQWCKELSSLDNLNGIIFLIAYSGGVDSTTIIDCCIRAIHDWILDPNNIFVTHYVHWIRPWSQHEYEKLAKLLHNKSKDLFLYGASLWKKIHTTEEYLRKSRYYYCYSLAKILSQIHNKQCLLVLWHHLDDRKETTLLNLSRGASLQGIINMTTLSPSHIKEEKTILFRPLLSLPKELLITYTKNNNLEYIEDITNTQPSISKRNYRRSIITKQLQAKNIFSLEYPESDGIFDPNWNTKWNWNSKVFYSLLESIQKQEEQFFIQNPPFVSFKTLRERKCWSYYFILNPELLYEGSLRYSLKKIWSNHGRYKSSLNNILTFISKQRRSKHSWRFQSWDIGIYIAHEIPYLFLTKDKFRENLSYHENKPLPIWYNQIDWRRRAKPKDTFHQKPLTKYLINKKIPIFYRKNILVQEVDNILIKVDIIKQ
jgi:tRNA(Ile)-lysidine synthetase-like protein